MYLFFMLDEIHLSGTNKQMKYKFDICLITWTKKVLSDVCLLT